MALGAVIKSGFGFGLRSDSACSPRGGLEHGPRSGLACGSKSSSKSSAVCGKESMNLTEALEGSEHIIERIVTDDEEMDAFLFSLGCYAGEPVTVISRVRGGCIVSLKDGRYTIDNELASAIVVQ
ncbi:MAG: ferrous iron transport protein A [Eggerthellaceae bacterium]|nr:ferrous iron transport protein A [Eggerthellaceae bacterium]